MTTTTRSRMIMGTLGVIIVFLFVSLISVSNLYFKKVAEYNKLKTITQDAMLTAQECVDALQTCHSNKYWR